MTNQKNNKAINIALWIAQGLLAVMFIMAGLMKATQPVEALTESLPWVANTPLALVKFIGLALFIAWGRSKKAPILAKN